MSHISLLIYDNQSPQQFRDILRDQIFDVSYSFVHPGGCNELKFSMPVTRKYPIDIQRWVGFNFELRAIIRGSVHWSGRLEDFDIAKSGHGIVYNAVAKGFGVNLDDQEYTSQNMAGLQTSSIFDSAITALTQQIDVRSITATGYTLDAGAAVTVKLATAAHIGRWIQNFGNSSNQDLVWYIEPDADGTVRVTLKARPSTADYETYLTEFLDSGFGMVGRQLANIVDVEYNNGASVVTRQDTGLQGAGPAGWNIKKTRRLVFPEIVHVNDANQLGDRALTSWKQAKLGVNPLKLPKTAFVWDNNKKRVHVDEIKAGRIMRLVDVSANRYPLSNISLSNEFLIAEVDWEDNSQILTITPESFDKQLETTIARDRSILAGRHTV